jgi:membrane protein YqaA with SNARE-associated domain
VNAEAYVIASQMSAVIGPIPIAIGIAIGQTIGKLLLFFGVREGKELPFVRHRRSSETALHRAGPARLRAVIAKLLDLVGQKRWGLPIVLIAAVIGFPPLYAVALLAGATTMRPLWFGLTVFVGRLCRFVLVASGFHGLHDWFF